MSEKFERRLKDFLGILVALPVSFGTMCLHAYTIICLWSWFIVPTFELKTLTMVPALGLALVIAYFTHQPINVFDEQKGWAKYITITCYSLGHSITFLGFGYIYHLFM